MFSHSDHRTSTSDSNRGRSKLLALLVALTTVAAAVALIVVLVNGSADGSPRSSATRQQNLAADRNSAAASTSAPAAAASTPATSTPATSTPAAPTSTPASSPATRAAAPKSAATTTHAAKPPLTYVVRRGDNLTVIAKWFHLHGYGSLYERNKAVIGNDPNLIVPGQRITVSSAGMTVGH